MAVMRSLASPVTSSLKLHRARRAPRAPMWGRRRVQEAAIRWRSSSLIAACWRHSTTTHLSLRPCRRSRPSTPTIPRRRRPTWGCRREKCLQVISLDPFVICSRLAPSTKVLHQPSYMRWPRPTARRRRKFHVIASTNFKG